MMIRPKVLITGSSGLLAHDFIANFSDEYEITAITHSSESERQQNVRYIEIDFSRDWTINVLPRKIDFIVHLAQSPKFRDFPKSALEIFNINLHSTMKLLDYGLGAGVKKFIFASTGGIYGSSPSPISTNSEILGPTALSHYFGSKLSAEIFVNNYSDFFAVDINRIFFMYGPRQSKTMLIPRLINSVLNADAIQLAGPNGILINPVFVKDVSRFLHLQLQDTESHVYNVAGPEILSIRALANSIQEHFGGATNFAMNPSADNIVADSKEFLSKLDTSPTSFADGIRAFIKD
jgi:nucleoside-diphosphate-sugar epimerase